MLENLSIFACVLLARLGLWVLPLRVVLGGVPQEADIAVPSSRGQEAEAVRMYEKVARTARWVPRATCLTQALASRWLLRRRGITVRLCMGVRKDGTMLKSHAWLELPGGACLGQMEAYVEMPLQDAVRP